jgi:hypothetical protein
VQAAIPYELRTPFPARECRCRRSGSLRKATRGLFRVSGRSGHCTPNLIVHGEQFRRSRLKLNLDSKPWFSVITAVEKGEGVVWFLPPARFTPLSVMPSETQASPHSGVGD